MEIKRYIVKLSRKSDNITHYEGQGELNAVSSIHSDPMMYESIGSAIASGIKYNKHSIYTFEGIVEVTYKELR